MAKKQGNFSPQRPTLFSGSSTLAWAWCLKVRTLRNILLLQKGKNQKATKACRVGDDFNRYGSLTEYVRERHSVVTNYGSNSWVAYIAEEYRIKTLVEKQGVQLNHPIDWEININRGILTGLNDAFVISTQERNRLVNDDPKNEQIIRKILRGRDLRRWYPEFSQWLIYIPWHFPLHEDHTISGVSDKAERAFQTEYPVCTNFFSPTKISSQNETKQKLELGMSGIACNVGVQTTGKIL